MKVGVKVGSKTVSFEENFLDRAIRYFAPVQANKRAGARLMALSGGYVGASTTRRQTLSWSAQKGDADAVINPDLPLLRERSRDLIRNAPLAVGAVNTVVTNVVGTGLRHKSKIDRGALNLTEEQADAWEAQAEREWRLWAESPECDLARTLRFSAMQDLAFRQTLENGDVFALTPNLIRPGSPYGLKIQLVEGDRVCNPNGAQDTATIAGGVERDANGAPLRYHILDQHPGSAFFSRKAMSWSAREAFGKTGRRNVIHLFKPVRPGQSRGVPYLAPVIEPLKQIDRYTEAEIMAAVVSGMFTVFVKSESGDVDLNPMAPATETGSAASDEDFKMASGAILNLARGESIEAADPSRPNTAFDPFVMAILRQVGVALELPFEVLVKHFTASYSAAQAALLEAWRFFRTRRQWLAENFCQVIYELWMDEAVALGRIKAPGYFSDPVLRKAYLGAEWIGPARGQIDSGKEVTAAQQRVDGGFSTIEKETTELTGGDWESNMPQIRRERRMLKEAGLIPDPKPSTSAPAPAEPPQNQDLPEEN